MDKLLNRLGVILYYTFNFVTFPIASGFLFFGIIYDYMPRWEIFECEEGCGNYLTFWIWIIVVVLVWRLQYLISDTYDHPKRFGIDFYRYKKRLEILNNLKPNYNKPKKSNKLYLLFKELCKDETVHIIHQKERINNLRIGDFENLTQIDKNFITGYNNTSISFYCEEWNDTYHNSGYKIELSEQPPLYLVRITSTFINKFPKHFNKDFPETVYNKCEDYKREWGENSLSLERVYSDDGNCLSYTRRIYLNEYAVIHGDIIDFISETDYNELVDLHCKAESNHNRYVLNKRLKSKNIE